MKELVWAPIAMSFGVMLIVVTNLVFRINPLPIHDEGALDHIGMLLYWGQLPLIGLYVLSNLSQLRKIATRLLVIAILFATITVLIVRTERMAKEGVAQRIAANLPMKGSEQALEKAILDTGSPAPTALLFKGVDKLGWDSYQAQFTDGQQEWRIFVDEDGKTAGVTYFDAEGRCHSTEPYECR